MAGAKLPHIVAYDIADPRRLGRVHRYLKKVALPLQYSVFLVELDGGQRERLKRRLVELIDSRQDDVRIYPLPSRPEWVCYGKPLWDEGLLLTNMRLPLHLRGKVDIY